ncbi:hypothetical protein [Candidatus Sneabacter namystus]|uniref:Uncharacterized protein n=1 Tax=Candidatus Sneabacter namystus TaxID=2601646 RepID=A0A5C0UK28_9RICK|nr:hypothetical protein [Candidatus Sneabacter namystus]QEK39903.1 hypothetical protein FZC37_03070 [Candidatus Sneabacter namystus]
MNSPLLFFFQSLGLTIFSPKFIAMLLRTLFVAVLVFLFCPLLFKSLSLGNKLQIFILCVLLLELISFRLFLVTQGNINPSKTRNQTNKDFIVRSFKGFLSKKNLSLLVLSNTVSIKDFVPKDTYYELAVEDINTEHVTLLDHFSKPLVAISLDHLRDVLKNIAMHPIIQKILDVIKSNSSDTVTFVVGFQDLISMQSKNNITIAMQSCCNMLHTYMNKRFNINFVVENLHLVTGFHEICNEIYPNNPDLTSLSIPISLEDEQITFTTFESVYANFIKKVVNVIGNCHFSESDKFQLIYIFMQQLHYLKEPLKEIMAIAIKTSKISTIRTRNQIQFNIFFLGKTESVTPPEQQISLVAKDLQLCLDKNEK